MKKSPLQEVLDLIGNAEWAVKNGCRNTALAALRHAHDELAAIPGQPTGESLARCENCGGPVIIPARGPIARTCGGACRVALSRREKRESTNTEK